MGVSSCAWEIYKVEKKESIKIKNSRRDKTEYGEHRMREKNRNISLDVARGVGIILVVIGHTMSPVMTGNTVMETAYQILYVFHMPLFFLLAGLVAQKLVGGGVHFFTN